MNKKIFLILSMVFVVNTAIADSQTYGSIIQRHSQQIKELQNKVLELENVISDLNITLKQEPIKDVFDQAVLPALLDDKTEYDMALAALKESDFNEAETKFAEFIEHHPSSSLQSNATFWYAESFYRRGMFNEAAINYLQSYKKYPTGSKAPDALLKLSYSLSGLNKNQEACSMLKKLETEFPDRSISSIKRTEEAKDKLYCKY
jgi:tol-pal system protein YbgF